MVNFRNRLGGKAGIKRVDPIEIYDTLDRAHDKGPLRPSQEAVLREWHARQANTRDVIVKLHTGQGKTLVGLHASVPPQCGQRPGGLPLP